MYVNGDNVTYFDSFGVEHIPKEITKLVGKNIFRVLLAKTKLNTIEVLISKALIDSNISHNEFVSANNMLREYDDLKEEVKFQ